MEISEGDQESSAVNPSPDRQSKTIKFRRFEVDRTVVNLFFALVFVFGQVGANVTLPLWIDSTILPPSGTHVNHTNAVTAGYSTNQSNHTNTSNGNGEGYQPRIDGFFVLSFASFSFVVIFGATLIFIRIFQPHRLGETERRFPHSQLFLVGFFDALSGVLGVFASSGRRTAPYLQAILANFMIPLTMALRYVKLCSQVS